MDPGLVDDRMGMSDWSSAHVLLGSGADDACGASDRLPEAVWGHPQASRLTCRQKPKGWNIFHRPDA